MEGQPDGLDVFVSRVHAETSEVRRFELEPVDGAELPRFDAGAHIDVFPLPGYCRQYSLLNDPNETGRYVIGVKRETNGRGGSSAMHSQLREGSRVRIGGPRNSFRLQDNTGRNILLAGGIGVTPLLSMCHALASSGGSFNLHYFVRSNQEVAFTDIINSADWAHNVYHHFGLVPPLLNEVLDEILGTPTPDDRIYLCGPTPFMDVVRSVAGARGWPDDHVILEHFSAERPKLVPGADEFVVRLARSGVELVVPSDKPIIDVLREAGINIKTSCEQGVCGTCVTSVLEGEPEHHDLYLSHEEQERGDVMTPCVSRARSRFLVLDI